MKNTIAIIVVFVFGVVVGWQRPSIPSVSAQQSAVTLSGCSVNGVSVGDCSQYVVQVQPARGFGRFAVFEVLDSPVDPSKLGSLGGGASVSINANEPDPRGAYTFTLSATEP